MKRRTTLIAVGVTVAAAVGIGTAVAAGVGDDDASDTPITGAALARASEAALAHTGQGQVTATEVGDEESMYEVEITLDNGDQVDVQLDENFRVVGDEVDTESEQDDD